MNDFMFIGHLRLFLNNSKAVLYDAKFNVLDSTFHRGNAIAVGDDMDMDKHLITVEGLTEAYATNSVDQRNNTRNATSRSATAAKLTAPTTASTLKFTSTRTKTTVNEPMSALSGMKETARQPVNDTMGIAKSSTQSDLKRRKWRPPIPTTVASTSTIPDSSLGDNEWEALDQFDLQDIFSDSVKELREPATGVLNTETGNTTSKSTAPTFVAIVRPAPKRRKVGLSRVTGAPGSAAGQSSLVTSHRPPSTQLEFPNAARCTNFTGKNQNQLLRRSMTLGSRFMSSNQYKDGMAFLIYEHLQIMVIEIAIAMWNIKSSSSTQEGVALDTVYRSRGIHMHSESTLRRRGDAYPGFPLYNDRASNGGGLSGTTTAAVQPTSQQGLSLSISNKEHHSKYSKDDLWVVSTTSRFDATSTFFARSVFYGPSGNDIELLCLSAKDSSVAREMLTHCTKVCAIRLLNAMSEFMMLDNMSESLTRTPLLPVLLNYVPPELVKASKTSVFKAPSRVPEKSGCLVLTEEDGIDVEKEIVDTIDKYRLNLEQAAVLRTFAQTVIRGPGWAQKSTESPPVILVHGVFGAGKSFLIAVLIVFIDNIINKARLLTREKTSCRFLVASMTNVAVDRILMALLDLNYTKFVRVGSLKKVARRVLPYTAQSNTSRTGEDIKELQSILDDDSLSIKERQYVKIAMKKFQKLENRGIVEGANVVGATCIASTFEVLDDATFPIVILDEASQLLEPMSLIPICRAAAEKLVMVGDPLQLSPPLSTNDDSPNSCKGLSRTLFDRSAEMGFKPIMLQTQYRCHSRIAEISNALFYSNVLRTGISSEDRAPLVENLPTLSFIDNVGQEIQNTRTKSFTNPAEIRLIVTFIRRLLNLNIPEANKSQADGIQTELSEQLKNSGLKGSVQISTVDAFQRVNVALTRSKRHLFIVGNSQLLSSNGVWGTVLRDHCSGSTDGSIKADQFMQLLRTLKPLPKQAVSDQAQLLVSEDEEDDPKEQEDEGQNTYYHQDEDLEYDEDGDIQEHLTSESATPMVSSRKYALYETDEDDSEDGYDGRGEKYDVKQPVGQQQRHRSQSYHREDQHPKPVHNSSAEYNMSQDSDFKPRPGVMKSAIAGTAYRNVANTAASFRSDHNDNFTSFRKNMTSQGQFMAHERDDSFAQAQTPDSGSLELGYHSSFEGISQLEDTLDGILETEIQSEVLLSREENRAPIKEEQGQITEGGEEVEEVIWEMDDEPDELEEERSYSDVDVTPGGTANTEGFSSQRQQWQHQQDLSNGDA
ncbi:hypothetical protein BGX26_010565, partial [Mortierella sp. AD094]